MNTQTNKVVADKFITDPDWHLIEEMIQEYIDPLRDVSTIDLSTGADAVMAEVAGRKIAYKQMTEFLRNCRILRQTINNKPITFK